MLKLADHANDEGGSCHPAQQTIAEKCNLSREYVNKVIRALEQDGKLAIDRVVDTNGKFKNHYHLKFTNLDGIVNSVHIPPSDNVNSDGQVREASSHTNVNSVHTNHQLIINEPSDTLSVFEFWKQTFSLNGNTRLTGSRASLIDKRLKEYGRETVDAAIRGCSIATWHVQNKQTDIEIILSINRNRNNVEKFARMWDEHNIQITDTMSADDQKMRESLKATQDMFYGR